MIRPRPRVPPTFYAIGMTDRSTGEIWVLMADTDEETIKLVSPPPAGFRGQVYGPYAGPRIEYDPHHVKSIRLFVQDGDLGFDVPPTTVTTRPVIAPDKMRATHRGTFYQLTVPEGFDPDRDSLVVQAWSES